MKLELQQVPYGGIRIKDTTPIVEVDLQHRTMTALHNDHKEKMTQIPNNPKIGAMGVLELRGVLVDIFFPIIAHFEAVPEFDGASCGIHL
jgi:hypothetical protein